MTRGAKPVAQKRSAETRDRILQALERLLREQDFDQLSVSEIASEAGVSVGTVYRRFENKEAFLPQLVERLRERAAAKADAEPFLPGADLHETLSALCLEAWREIAGARPLYRTIYLYSRQKPETLDDLWQEVERNAPAQVTALLDHHADEIVVEDRALADRMVAYFVGTIFVDRALFERTVPGWIREINGEALARQAAAMAHAYLTMQPVSR